ncbi:hypothetical protein E0H26_00360 [Micromonospora zingiberis]|uniref:N-acetyltransferase n=1 Tax=Micromonospora zingiberis TaxID=2053011 RepID=A0A4R0GRC7_9ACTN|nr:hypothetical protein [Micromonospora zingiberis]TCC00197.1 hypothetical protein E0H26_00360 [Micromonospora zingiberis]
MHLSPPVNRARWRDIDWIVDLVTATVAPTTLGAWLVPDQRRRPAVLAAAARIWIEHALLFGDAFLLKDGAAATVWFHRYRPTPPPPRYEERIEDACGEHVVRFRRLEQVLAARRPQEAHNHLAILAAPPDADRAAQAAAVLTGSHRLMDTLGLPMYAETHNDADRRLYRRLGYRERHRVSRPDGALLDVLWRPAPSLGVRTVAYPQPAARRTARGGGDRLALVADRSADTSSGR